MQSKTLGAITLGPDRSAIAGNYFVNLLGRKFTAETGHHFPFQMKLSRKLNTWKKDEQLKLLINIDKKVIFLLTIERKI